MWVHSYIYFRLNLNIFSVNTFTYFSELMSNHVQKIYNKITILNEIKHNDMCTTNYRMTQNNVFVTVQLNIKIGKKIL